MYVAFKCLVTVGVFDVAIDSSCSKVSSSTSLKVLSIWKDITKMLQQVTKWLFRIFTCKTCGSFASLILPTLVDFNDMTPLSTEPSSTVVSPTTYKTNLHKSLESNCLYVNWLPKLCATINASDLSALARKKPLSRCIGLPRSGWDDDPV